MRQSCGGMARSWGAERSREFPGQVLAYEELREDRSSTRMKEPPYDRYRHVPVHPERIEPLDQSAAGAGTREYIFSYGQQ